MTMPGKLAKDGSVTVIVCDARSRDDCEFHEGTGSYPCQHRTITDSGMRQCLNEKVHDALVAEDPSIKPAGIADLRDLVVKLLGDVHDKIIECLDELEYGDRCHAITRLRAQANRLSSWAERVEHVAVEDRT